MTEEQVRSRVTVLALDRWGRVLVVEREGEGAPPSTALRGGESPDAGALRVFEEATGTLLGELRLFRTGERGQHVYYCDPDLTLEDLAPQPGTSVRYIAPGEIETTGLAQGGRALLARFVGSSSYRAMFH